MDANLGQNLRPGHSLALAKGSAVITTDYQDLAAGEEGGCVRVTVGTERPGGNPDSFSRIVYLGGGQRTII